MSISRLKLAIFIITSFSFAFLLIEQVLACGPFFLRYIYTPEDVEKESNPFLFIDIDSFLNSKYEIVLSGWGPRSLYPIYRDLIGNKLTQQEKESLLRYYNQEFYDVYQQSNKAIALWKEARKLVTKEDVQVETYKCENYSCYTNCLPDAFLTAANTLRERSKIYNGDELKIWLDGQDKVFSNCGTPESVGFGPSVLAASAQRSINSSGNQSLSSSTKEFFVKIKEFFVKIFNKIAEIIQGLFVKKPVKPDEKINTQDLLRYDREYQQAALAFYQGDLDGAEKIFKEISDNRNNPWRAYATISLGRVYIRRGGAAYEEVWERNWDIEEASQTRGPHLEKAKVIFENVLKDDSLSLIHEGANSLLNYVNFRIDPEKRFRDAEGILLTSHNAKEVVNNLEDFSLLFSQFRNDEKYILEKEGDLSQWIYVWKNPNQINLEFALEKYQQTKSLPWLLASLKLMAPEHPLRDEIIRESLKIPKDSPAYLTANYYRLRLLIKIRGNVEEIRKDIDSILETIPEESSIAKNYFNDLRMLVAKNLTESLSYSLRKVVAVETDITSRVAEKSYLIDGKVKQLFNESLPLEKWTEVASANDMFSPEIIKQMRLITFVRAVLLDDFGTAKRIANLSVSTDSTLKEDLSGFLQAKNYDEKKFTTALFILKYYRLNHILDSRLDELLVDESSVKEKDIYRRNWWCEYPPQYGYKSYELNDLTKFISFEEIQTAKLENEKIYKIIAPNYLSEVVINYALENPNDLRVPEALHLAVMSTRSAKCKDKKTSEFSQRAFQVLHSNYPNNYWTQQTPYWY